MLHIYVYNVIVVLYIKKSPEYKKKFEEHMEKCKENIINLSEENE